MPPRQADDQLTAIRNLIAAQANARAQLVAQATAMAAQSASRFSRWYDAAAITAWAEATAAAVQPILRVLAQTTDAYLARILSAMTGDRVRPVGRVDVDPLRNGVSNAAAFARAADVWRYQQSRFDGVARQLAAGVVPNRLPEITQPVDAAVERVRAVANLDTQLVFRAQSQASMADAHRKGLVLGYRRVIHPELSKGGTCGLCVAASDRVYKVSELLPIHDRCECGVVQILDKSDLGHILNRDDFKTLYKLAGGTGAAGLKKVLYRVDEHGELGPILVPRDAVDRRHRARATTEPSTAAEKAAAMRRARTMLDTAIPKAEQLAAGDPRWRPYVDNLRQRVQDLDRDLAENS